MQNYIIRSKQLICPTVIFVVFSILFGLIFVFVTPPFEAPDEIAHYCRAYQISEGQIIGVRKGSLSGGFLPNSIKTFIDISQGIPENPNAKQNFSAILEQFHQELNPETKIFIDFRGSVVYSPIPYMPQALGIAIGRLFNFPPIVLLYFGRLFNLFAWIILTFLAIRQTPIFKWVFVLISLMPTTMFIAASLSADAATIGLSLLIIATILRYDFSSFKIRTKEILFLATFFVLIGLAKQVYLVLLILLLFIPENKFDSKRKYIGGLALIILPTFVISGLWTIVSSKTFVPNFVVNLNIAPLDQLRYILFHPIRYINLTIGTVFINPSKFLYQFIGVLGWLDTLLPKIIYVSYTGALFAAALFDHTDDIELTKYQKPLLFGTFLIGAFIIITIGYLLWSNVGASKIDGVQGRYFIPISPLLFIPYYDLKIIRKIPENLLSNLKLLIPVYLCIILIITIHTVFIRYYG